MAPRPILIRTLRTLPGVGTKADTSPRRIYQTSSQGTARRLSRRHIQVIPHVTNAIKDFHPRQQRDMTRAVRDRGTFATSRIAVLRGDRPIKNDLPRDHAIYIHLSSCPSYPARGTKDKTDQHSVKELRSIGIQPDILLCRTDRPIPRKSGASSACSATCGESGR